MTFTPETQLVDGFYRLPVKVKQAYRPEPGTVEWLLNAIERHARAGRTRAIRTSRGIQR
jgi:hypothetical protein